MKLPEALYTHGQHLSLRVCLQHDCGATPSRLQLSTNWSRNSARLMVSVSLSQTSGLLEEGKCQSSKMGGIAGAVRSDSSRSEL